MSRPFSLLILLCLLGASAAWAAEPVSPFLIDIRGSHSFKLPIVPREAPFTFEYVGNAENNPVEIRCFRPGADRPFQVIDLSSFEPPPRDAVYLSAADMNRDGYKDLRVLGAWGVTGNRSFAHYLWSPSTRRFEPASSFDVCREPTDAAGCCKSHWVGGMAGNIFGDAVHCLKNHRLVLVKEVSQKWSDSDQCFHKETRVREHGRMKVTSTEVVCDPFWQESRRK